MKNKWLHISLSAGYLVSIAITVLIIYVMNPPVSNAVQGAYLVAVVLPGVIIGGCSLIFPDMTEGLGCLLGGFCFSMWLLVMKSGGLIPSTSGKSIFIAAISVAAFALSFSHYTRTYGLIVSISFSGSTAIVLGIDCFSRAGLKEFWIYIWNLNPDLFPLGATTYPVTRGIRVEIAAIFVLFLAGLVSQSKVHKFIQDRRAQRMAEREENARALEEEETNVGRRIEDKNVTEKEQWERIYGDKVQSEDKSTRDSGVGDMESSRRGPASSVTSITELDGREIKNPVDSSFTSSKEAGLIVPNYTGHERTVTVRVARDIEPELTQNEGGDPVPLYQSSQGSAASQPIITSAEGEIQDSHTNEAAHRVDRPFQKLSTKVFDPTITSAPEIVPLPFKVPENVLEDDQSSVATFADEERAIDNKVLRKVSSNGTTLPKRLSVMSKRESTRYSRVQGISIEDRTRTFVNRDDRASSIAATVDDLSDDEDMVRSVHSSLTGQDLHKPDMKANTNADQANEQDKVSSIQKTIKTEEDTSREIIPSTQFEPSSEDTELRPESGMTVATDILDSPRSETFLNEQASTSTDILYPPGSEKFAQEVVPTQQPSTLIGGPEAERAEIIVGANAKRSLEDGENETESKSKAESSAMSAVDVKTSTLTKDQLPSQISKVVMSYRTNEWAKHLSHADSPQLEELDISEDVIEDSKTELVVPVDVEALQQTAHNAQPPPVRSASRVSFQTPVMTRSNSAQSNAINSAAISKGSSFRGKGGSTRNSSQQSLGGISLHKSQLNVSNSNIADLIASSPGRESTPSPRHLSQIISPQYGSPTTLMGKRDTMIRNRSSYFSAANLSSHTMALISDPHQFAPSQFQSSDASQMGSETGSLANHYGNPQSPIFAEDGDDLPLSHRRELIRQSTQPSIQPPTNFDSHQPKRRSVAVNPIVREQQLATWRASVTYDLQVQKKEINGVERQRSVLWQERQAKELKMAAERRGKEKKEERRDERMRANGPGMEELHRKMLSKMQDEARRNDLSS